MNYQQQRLINDWSGRHVRLKFQMIMSSAVFYLVARYGAQKLSLPLIKFEETVDTKLIIWCAFTFALFTTFSFLLRTSYEANLWAKKELSGTLEIWEFSRRFTHVRDYLVSLTNPLKVEELNSDTMQMAQSSVSYINMRMSELSDLHEENGVISPVHPKFWGKLVNGFSTVNSSANKISKHIYHMKEMIDVEKANESRMKKLDAQIKHERTNLVISFDEFEPKKTRAVRRLFLSSFVNWTQIYLFSVVVPSVASFMLIVLGVEHIRYEV